MPLAVVVALAVDAAPQAGLGEDAVLDLALAAQLHLALEDVDLLGQVRRHPVEEPPPPVGRAHGRSTALVVARSGGKYQITRGYSSFARERVGVAVRDVGQRADDLDAHRVADGDLHLAAVLVVERERPVRDQALDRLLGRGHRHADHARLQRPEEALGEPGRLGCHSPAFGMSWRYGSAWVNAFIMFSASLVAKGSVRTTLGPLSNASSATGSATRIGRLGALLDLDLDRRSSRSRLPGRRSSASWPRPRPRGCLGSVSRVRHGATPSAGDVSAGILTHGGGVAARALPEPVDPVAALAAIEGRGWPALVRHGGATVLAAGPAEVVTGPDVWDALARPPRPRGGPAAMAGGWIGLLAYDLGGTVERLPPPRPDPGGPPLAALARYDTVAVVDDDGRCVVASAAGGREADDLAAAVAAAAPLAPLPPAAPRPIATSLPGGAYAGPSRPRAS